MTIDQKSVDRTIKTLNKLSRSALPTATRYTLNELAWKSRGAIQQQMRKDFTLRNRWTEGSVRVNQARQYDIKDMESEVGSTRHYMKIQNEGGRVRGRYKNKAIPNDKARKGGVNSTMVVPKYRSKNLSIVKGKSTRKKRSRKQFFIAQAAVGKREKKAIKVDNIVYWVKSFRRSPDGVNFELIPLYKYKTSGVGIKKKEWLSTAVRKYYSQQYVDKVFYSNAIKQIRKLTQ